MKLFMDLEIKSKYLKIVMRSILIMLFLIYITLFYFNLLDSSIFLMFIFITPLFFMLFYQILLLLIKQSYQGKTIRILKINDSHEKDVPKDSKSLNLTAGYLNMRKSHFLSYCYNMDNFHAPQRFTILRIHKNHLAFLEQVVTKRKHIVDLRMIDAEIIV